MPGRVIVGVPRWRRSQSNSSSLLGPSGPEGQRDAGHGAWLASPTKVGRVTPGDTEYTLRAVWRSHWGAGGTRRMGGMQKQSDGKGVYCGSCRRWGRQRRNSAAGGVRRKTGTDFLRSAHGTTCFLFCHRRSYECCSLTEKMSVG